MRSNAGGGGSGRVLGERGAPALEAPEFVLQLRPGITLDALVLIAGEVAEPLAVGHPSAAGPIVKLTKLVEVRGGSGHFTSFPRMWADPTRGTGHGTDAPRGRAILLACRPARRVSRRS